MCRAVTVFPTEPVRGPDGWFPQGTDCLQSLQEVAAFLKMDPKTVWDHYASDGESWDSELWLNSCLCGVNTEDAFTQAGYHYDANADPFDDIVWS